MNNIIFSKLTRKQVIELYSKREYKKTIELIRNVFGNRRNFKEYLKEYGKEIDSNYMSVFNQIMYMWDVRDEFKYLLNGNIDLLTINYFEALNKDYINFFFNKEEIEMLKEECKKYYDKQVNGLLARNYELGNFDYVVDSLKHDYKSHAEFESKVGVNCCSEYEKVQLLTLREISHIYRHMDFSKSDNNVINYYYAMLNNLISIYNNQDIEYVERYLYRQHKIGVSLTEVFNNKELLGLFNQNDYNVLIKIYDNHIKEGLKVAKRRGYGLYNTNEYVNSLHIIMTVLEIPGNEDEKYYKMKNEYNYINSDLRVGMNSNLPKKALNPTAYSEYKNLYNGYINYLEEIEKNILQERKSRQIKEVVELIESLLDNDIYVDAYFNKTQILKNEFKKILEFIKVNCPELYSKYLTDKNEKIRIASLTVVEKMKTCDNFDEIDYYSTTNVSYNDVRKYLSSNDFESYLMFSDYLKSVSEQPVIRDNKLIAYCESVQTLLITRSNGVREIVEPTKEEKMYVINLLKELGAPITHKNIDSGLKRYYKEKEIGYEKRITL